MGFSPSQIEASMWGFNGEKKIWDFNVENGEEREKWWEKWVEAIVKSVVENQSKNSGDKCFI